MRRLICTFVVRIWHKTRFLMARILCYYNGKNNSVYDKNGHYDRPYTLQFKTVILILNTTGICNQCKTHPLASPGEVWDQLPIGIPIVQTSGQGLEPCCYKSDLSLCLDDGSGSKWQVRNSIYITNSTNKYGLDMGMWTTQT